MIIKKVDCHTVVYAVPGGLMFRLVNNIASGGASGQLRFVPCGKEAADDFLRDLKESG